MTRRRSTARAIAARSLQSRLTDLEDRAGINAEPFGAFFVAFVDRDGPCHCDWASELDGSVAWHREQDETQEEFKQRVMADAPKGSGQSFTVVIFWTVEDPSPGQGIAD
jgi:hypothetical protein